MAGPFQKIVNQKKQARQARHIVATGPSIGCWRAKNGSLAYAGKYGIPVPQRTYAGMRGPVRCPLPNRRAVPRAITPVTRKGMTVNHVATDSTARPKKFRNEALHTPTDLHKAEVNDLAAALNGILADVFTLYVKTKKLPLARERSAFLTMTRIMSNPPTCWRSCATRTRCLPPGCGKRTKPALKSRYWWATSAAARSSDLAIGSLFRLPIRRSTCARHRTIQPRPAEGERSDSRFAAADQVPEQYPRYPFQSLWPGARLCG